MEDRELYRRILGIESPWRVASVDLQLTPQEVHIYLAHEDLPRWPCAECAAPSQLYDHQPERQWRHLDTCQYRTILHSGPPTTPWSPRPWKGSSPAGIRLGQRVAWWSVEGQWAAWASMRDLLTPRDIAKVVRRLSAFPSLVNRLKVRSEVRNLYV